MRDLDLVAEHARPAPWQEQEPEAAVSPDEGASWVAQELLALLKSFLLWVGAPMLLVALYVFGVAADQYQAEAQFVVRGRTNPTPSESSGTLGAVIAANTNQDTYIAANYISSGAVLAKLTETFDFEQIYRKAGIDPLPALEADATAEELGEYWPSVADARVDPISGVVTVTIRAFEPGDAVELLKSAIAHTEDELNTLHRLYLQSNADLAEGRVTQATQRLAQARADIKAFREKNKALDTAAGARSTFEMLSELRNQRIQVRAQLAVKRAETSADSPGSRVLQRRLDALDKQIADLEAQLTSSVGDMESLSAAVEAYDALMLQETVASQFLTRALAAQNDALQRLDAREVYLESFVPPAVPEESRYPKRWQILLYALGSLTALWAFLSLLLAGLREHQA